LLRFVMPGSTGHLIGPDALVENARNFFQTSSVTLTFFG